MMMPKTGATAATGGVRGQLFDFEFSVTPSGIVFVFLCCKTQNQRIDPGTLILSQHLIDPFMD
jgi:hypothetical protein